MHSENIARRKLGGPRKHAALNLFAGLTSATIPELTRASGSSTCANCDDPWEAKRPYDNEVCVNWIFERNRIDGETLKWLVSFYKIGLINYRTQGLGSFAPVFHY